MNIHDAIWLRSTNVVALRMHGHVYAELIRRGVHTRIFDTRSIWEAMASSSHLVLDGLTPTEMRLLRPALEARGNFSVMAVDWWLTPEWASRCATFEFVRNYSGIANSEFLQQQPPWLTVPDRAVPYEWACAALRPLALAAAPVRALWRRVAPPAGGARARRLFFPYAVNAADFPDCRVDKRWDIANFGAVFGAWLCRSRRCAPAADFANLYADRKRIANILRKFDGVYDWRDHGRLEWHAMADVVRASRFALVTGGLHGNSVAKYLETILLGTPIFGTGVPGEYPWLAGCIHELHDPLGMLDSEIILQAFDALDASEEMAAACAAVKPLLLKLYAPGTLLDALQEQVNGMPIREGYLK